MKTSSLLFAFLIISAVSVSGQLSKFSKPGSVSEKHTVYEYKKSNWETKF